MSLLYPSGSERQRLEGKYTNIIREDFSFGRIVSFVGNKSIPLLRLYRFKEAFAFNFVERFLSYFKTSKDDYVFDPFVGMGTTLYASMLRGIPSIGIDKLPIAAFIAQTLPRFLSIKSGELKSTFEKLKHTVLTVKPADVALDVPIMKIAFTNENLLTLRKWKAAIDSLESPYKEIFLLLLFSILEQCSFTSKDGQFLRIKRNKRPVRPEEALYMKVLEAEQDLIIVKHLLMTEDVCYPEVYEGDARDLSFINFKRRPTIVITSPPYPNRYDYTRTYCLELCFHFVKNFDELKSIRFSILRSHIESKVESNEKPSHPAIAEAVEILNNKELNNPRIPHMLTAYFNDMKKVIEQWSIILARNSKVAMVIDNVRFEGELIPTDLIFSEMAEDVGFQVREIIVSRYKGNSSQQMKKYGKVPVRESIVVWELKP
jgi:site-specific DNA-methyltransferase (cytosine-N4-specific)